MDKEKLKINDKLVQRLIANQIPQWKSFFVKQITPGGWDNRTFRLGEKMVIRMPSSEKYADQIKKEYYWLPILAPLLPLEIPDTLLIGKPDHKYPWNWLVYRWLEGKTASLENISDLCDFAVELAEFLIALQSIDTKNGPKSGQHNFYRGGELKVYDSEVRHAIEVLKNEIDVEIVAEIWQASLESKWQQSPVWIHGDISVGNLLVKNGRLNAVIDFGMLGIGDPACDFVISWTLFDKKSREVFQEKLSIDDGTWARARGWALWKALIIVDGTSKNTAEIKQSWYTINEVITDFQRVKKL